MNLKEEALKYFGVEIDPTVEFNLGKSITSKSSSYKNVYGFAITSISLGFDPSVYLSARLTDSEVDEILDAIENEFDFGEKLNRNIIYIAYIWAFNAKKELEGKQQRHKDAAYKVIDYVASTAVKYWTLEPIINQSDIPGVHQRLASTILRFLVKRNSLSLIKQGGNGVMKSNVYGIHTTKEWSYELIEATFNKIAEY